MAKETAQERIDRLNRIMGGAPQLSRNPVWDVDPNAGLPTTPTTFDRSAIEKQYEGYINPLSVAKNLDYQIYSYKWDAQGNPIPKLDAQGNPKPVMVNKNGTFIPLKDSKGNIIPEYEMETKALPTLQDLLNEKQKLQDFEWGDPKNPQGYRVQIDPDLKYAGYKRSISGTGGAPTAASLAKINAEAQANKAEIDAAINKFANEGGAGWTQAQLDAIRNANSGAAAGYDEQSGKYNPSALQLTQRMIGGNPNISASGEPLIPPIYASGEGKKGTLKIGALKGLSAPDYAAYDYSIDIPGVPRPTPKAAQPVTQVTDPTVVGYYNTIQTSKKTQSKTDLTNLGGYFNQTSAPYKKYYDQTASRAGADWNNFIGQVTKADPNLGANLLKAYQEFGKQNRTVWGATQNPNAVMTTAAQELVSNLVSAYESILANQWDDGVLRDKIGSGTKIAKVKGTGNESTAINVLSTNLALATLKRLANGSDQFAKEAPKIYDKPAGSK